MNLYLHFLFIFLQLNLSNSMTFNGSIMSLLYPHLLLGFQIRDLYANDETFISDAEEWIPTAVRNNVTYSDCNGTLLVGGFDVLGDPGSNWGVEGYNFSRTYENLPPHNIIIYTLSLWLIDSWDAVPPDYFQIEFDSILAEGWGVGHDNFTVNYCGNPDWPDLPNMTIYGRISHSNPELTIRVISQLDGFAGDESLGFRDLNLIFTNSTENSVNDLCGLAPIPLPTNECLCGQGQYFETSGIASCQDCNESCSSCFGSSSQECFQCKEGYSFVGLECILCDESCESCYAPGKNHCSSCPEGMFLWNNGTCISGCEVTDISGKVCESPCLTGEFYFPEIDVCFGACEAPIAMASGVQLCISPCSSQSGFLYWDGTCNSLCPLPLQERGLDNSFCAFECGSSEYLYWDGSCGSTCNDPFASNQYKNREFCQHPCSDPTDFIYWNGTCGNVCEAPLKTSSDGKASYCAPPCLEGQFWNGSVCLNSCQTPLKIREEGGILHCENPCSSSEYLYWNGSCLGSCPSPYKITLENPNIKSCNYPCDQYDDYYYPKKGHCLPNCNPPFVAEIIGDEQAWYLACVESNTLASGDQLEEENSESGSQIGPIDNPVTAMQTASKGIVNVGVVVDVVFSSVIDSHVMILILTTKILSFIRYLEIQFPSRLQEDLRAHDRSNFYLNFGPAMGATVKEKFTMSHRLPSVFERYDDDIHSRFLVNFFRPITSSLIILGIIGLLMILKRVLGRKKQQHAFVKVLYGRIEMFFRWNIVILLLICNVDEIVLFAILEWKTIDIKSFQDVVSLITSFGGVILSCIIIVAPFYLLRKIYKTRFKVLSNRANEQYFELLKKIEGFQVLWKNYKDSCCCQRAFLSCYLLRIALIYLIVALLYSFPLIQTLFFLLLNLFMLGYVIIVKPYKTTLNLLQNLMYEVLMLIIACDLLLLAILDHTQSDAEQLRIFLGDSIMFCNMWVSLVAMVFFVIKLGFGVQEIWDLYKKVPKTTSWLDFGVLVLQDNDVISKELGRNEKTSTKLDLTKVEKEIEKKNLARYSISASSSTDSPVSNSGSHDELQFSFIQRRSQMRIRRSLFSPKKQSADIESEKLEEISLKDDRKFSFEEANNLESPNKKRASLQMRKILWEIPLNEAQEKKVVDQEKLDRITIPEVVINEKDLKGLETIKELDSLDITENKKTQQRSSETIQYTLQGETSPMSTLKMRLSEGVHKAPENMEIITDKTEVLRRKWQRKENSVAQELVFE